MEDERAPVLGTFSRLEISIKMQLPGLSTSDSRETQCTRNTIWCTAYLFSSFSPAIVGAARFHSAPPLSLVVLYLLGIRGAVPRY